MINKLLMKTILLILIVFMIVLVGLFAYKIEEEKISQMDKKLSYLQINVQDQIFPEEKLYLDATATMKFPSGTGNIIDADIQIRARGNGSLKYLKKSYKIKFDNSVSLFGDEDKAKDWVLLANFIDLSMFRNYYTHKCAELFDNILFTPKTNFIEVSVNGDYLGVFQLYESIEFDEARLNVDDSIQSAQNGFLIERDIETVGEENVDYVVVDNVAYNIKSDIYSIEQANYLKKTIHNVEQTILSKNQFQIEQVIDVESSIDIYIIQEFTKNIDVGWGSFYMYLYPNNDKIYFGPPWDFDLAFGNDFRLDDGSYEGLYVGNKEYDVQQKNPLLQELMQQGWYQNMVLNRWNEKKHIFLELKDYIIEINEKYKDTFLKDNERWPFYSRLNEHVLIPQHLREITTFEQQFDYLINWIENRYEWLDDYFNYEMLNEK